MPINYSTVDFQKRGDKGWLFDRTSLEIKPITCVDPCSDSFCSVDIKINDNPEVIRVSEFDAHYKLFLLKDKRKALNFKKQICSQRLYEIVRHMNQCDRELDKC